MVWATATLANQFFCITLQLTIVHHHTKFGYKRLSGSEVSFSTKPGDMYSGSGHTDMGIPVYPTPPTLLWGINTHTHTHTHAHACAHTQTNTQIHAFINRISLPFGFPSPLTPPSLFLSWEIKIQTHTATHAHTHTHRHAYMHVCMHKTHTHIHKHTLL